MIDNYDSFTYNIVALLKKLGVKPIILKNDCSLQTIQNYQFTHLIISPGAGHPSGALVCLEAIRYFAPSKKILGICLGHQCIAHVFGGQIVPLKNPCHGKTQNILFKKNPLFLGLKQNIKVALYHSLYVNELGNCDSLAFSSNGICMALKAKKYDCYGIQFHPESILQEKGKKIINNFLHL